MKNIISQPTTNLQTVNLQKINLSCHQQIKLQNGDIRYCKNKCKINNDYCHIHIKLQTQEPIKNSPMDKKFLDDNFSYTLMGLYDSWNDIDENEIIYMDNEYWNVDILISHFTQQLNTSSMENPYTIYPSSPFTRKLFSVESLIILKDKLHLIKKPINIALKLLLNQSLTQLQLIYDNVDTNNFSKIITELFRNDFRYMLINSKNSQDVYIGFWVKNNVPLTPFEKLYDKLKNMSYQVISNGYIIPNNKRVTVEKKMDKCVNKYDMDKNCCECI